MQHSFRFQFFGCGSAIATQLCAKKALCVASHNKAIKYAPVGRPTLLTSRGLWRRYAALLLAFWF